jgi:NAD+ kinase
MRTVNTVGVFSKPNIAEARQIVTELLDWLNDKGVATRIDEQTALYSGRTDGLSRDAVVEGTETVIVLGGDGTLLAAARAIGHREIPILAVNLGGLGFLTALTLEQMYPEMERALEGKCRIGPRRMLHCEVVRKGERLAEYEALNDAVFAKTELARMINIDVHVDAHYVCRYRADGLIVSTPTGSTAYSLSAGGPIIFPTVDTLCLTPICPHMLTNRPVLVPGEAVIRVDVLDDTAPYLTVDGQVGQPLEKGDQVFCKNAKTKVMLIRPPHMLYFDVLRAKLKWGAR